MIDLPAVGLPRVLQRVSSIWHPTAAAHVLIYGQTGSGKTTLGQSLLDLCPLERAVIFDPKPHADPVWDGPRDDPWRYGKPVTALYPQFGYDAEGGGPAGRWFRLIGDPDREETARRFAAGMAIVATEGHAVTWLDDVKETCRQLRLRSEVDSLLSLGRSAGVLAILSTVDVAYVEGRAQAGIAFVGATAGITAAKDGAEVLGHTGRDWYDTTAAVQPHRWIYNDSQSGTAGPCLTTFAR